MSMATETGFGPVFVVATLGEAAWTFHSEAPARACWAALVADRTSCCAVAVHEHPSGRLTTARMANPDGSLLLYVDPTDRIDAPSEPRQLGLLPQWVHELAAEDTAAAAVVERLDDGPHFAWSFVDSGAGYWRLARTIDDALAAPVIHESYPEWSIVWANPKGETLYGSLDRAMYEVEQHNGLGSGYRIARPQP